MLFLQEWNNLFELATVNFRLKLKKQTAKNLAIAVMISALNCIKEVSNNQKVGLC